MIDIENFIENLKTEWRATQTLREMRDDEELKLSLIYQELRRRKENEES